MLPQAPLSAAAAILKNDGVSAVPVIDDHGTLLGLVTAVDVVQAVARWSVDLPADSQQVPRGQLIPAEQADPPSISTSQRRPRPAAMSANAAFILAAGRAGS